MEASAPWTKLPSSDSPASEKSIFGERGFYDTKSRNIQTYKDNFQAASTAVVIRASVSDSALWATLAITDDSPAKAVG